MMTKICTDVEQSNKLIKLGIDINTADMCYHFIEINKTPLCIRWEKVHDDEKDNSIPAWSLAALISVLPRFIEFKGDKYYLRFMKEYVEYANDEVSITGRYLHTTGNDNLVDACHEMILKLKENNLL